jgi:hypothetical protein
MQCVDCGAQARDYDHRDYNKPLEVDPVCRRCNLRRGPAIEVASRIRRVIAEGRQRPVGAPAEPETKAAA